MHSFADPPANMPPADGTWEEAARLLKRTVRQKNETRKFPRHFNLGVPSEDLQPLVQASGNRIPPLLLRFLASITPKENQTVDLGMLRLHPAAELADLNTNCAPFCNLIEDAPKAQDIQFLGIAGDGGGDARAYDLKYGGVCFLDVSADWRGSHDATLDLCPEYFPSLLDWVEYVRKDELTAELRQDSYASSVYSVVGPSNPDGEPKSVTVVPVNGMLPGNELGEITRQNAPDELVVSVRLENTRLLFMHAPKFPSQQPANLGFAAAMAMCELSRSGAGDTVTMLLPINQNRFSWSTAISGRETDWKITAARTQQGVTLNLPAFSAQDVSDDKRTVKYLSMLLPGVAVAPAMVEPLKEFEFAYMHSVLLLYVENEQVLRRLEIDRSLGTRQGPVVLMTAGRDSDLVFKVCDGHYGKYSGLNEPPILSSVVPYWAQRTGKSLLKIKQLIDDSEAVLHCRLKDNRVEFDVDVTFTGNKVMAWEPPPPQELK